MYLCIRCKFPVPLDDMATPTRNGACFCLRCYKHLTEDEKPMPKALRREIVATLAGLEAA